MDGMKRRELRARDREIVRKCTEITRLRPYSSLLSISYMALSVDGLVRSAMKCKDRWHASECRRGFHGVGAGGRGVGVR
jgi:hypothetical protein